MNVYLRATKTPTQMILRISHETAKAVEDDFSGDGYEAVRELKLCEAVRERERSSSLWIRVISLDIFPGGGKAGSGLGSQVNISGVNGLPGGILLHGRSIS